MRRLLFASIFTLICFPALAIDFSSPILGPDNKPTTLCRDEAKREGCAPLTLGTVASTALMSTLPSDEKISGEQKAKNGALGVLILNMKGDLKLSAEQIALIKQRVGELYPPLTVYRAWMLLDPNTKL